MNTQAVFFSTLFDAERPLPALFKARNGADIAARFAVYRNNVMASLIAALADTFPVTRALVGEPFFRAMASVFVPGQPPRSPVLADYGANFPDFIAHFSPAASLPYLADLARLEWAYVCAFHAADAAPLDPAALTPWLSRPDALSRLRFAFHPSARLVASPFAIVSLWAAHQRDPIDLSDLDLGNAETALIVRPAQDVEVLRLDPGTGLAIGRLFAGQALGEATEAALAHYPDFDVARGLALLMRSGALAQAIDPQEISRDAI